MVKLIHPTSMYTSTCINHSSVGQTSPINPCFYRDSQDINSWLVWIGHVCGWPGMKLLKPAKVGQFTPSNYLWPASLPVRTSRAVLSPPIPHPWWDEDEVMRKSTNLRYWSGAILSLSLLHGALVTTEVRLFMKTAHGAFAVNLANFL